ncbi:hypothetical protein M758_12G145800, partial [Ceratodon purpureus]
KPYCNIKKVFVIDGTQICNSDARLWEITLKCTVKPSIPKIFTSSSLSADTYSIKTSRMTHSSHNILEHSFRTLSTNLLRSLAERRQTRSTGKLPATTYISSTH